jgi:hypothetical protein
MNAEGVDSTLSGVCIHMAEHVSAACVTRLGPPVSVAADHLSYYLWCLFHRTGCGFTTKQKVITQDLIVELSPLHLYSG